MKPHINALLAKEMDRKTFLKHIAVAGVMLLGGGLILQSINGISKFGVGQRAEGTKGSYGYGDSVYGGSGDRA